jgi:hypothetical protein
MTPSSSPHLLRRVALKDAWSSKNVDEDGHKPFKEWGIDGTAGIVFQTVAQSGCGFHFDLDI